MSIVTKRLTFLRQLAAKCENAVLLEEKDLPFQTQHDNKDPNHANEAARARFTEAAGRVLQHLPPS